MEMTLDEYLEEVDRWKEAALEQTQALPPAARDEVYRRARDWLEAKIGRRLEQAPGKTDEVIVRA